MKKNLLVLFLFVCLAVMLSGCGSKPKTELTVFAAASMTETMETIKTQYEKNHNVAIVYNFDSSGTLKTQIEEGAVCDLFISASPKQMNALTVVDESTRIDLLENKVALVVPEGNPANLASFDDLIARLKDGKVLMAMGNSDVPVGQYTQKIFAYYEISEEAVSFCLSYGSNVKEVTTQVAEAAVECGIVYGTDAFSAGLTVIDTATAEMCGQVIYPAAVLTTSTHQAEAKEFLNYLKGAEASEVFKGVGFSPIQ